ncbi:unnamed protein product, partial [Cochlearia groenlandica]
IYMAQIRIHYNNYTEDKLQTIKKNEKDDPWITVTPINPRGRIYGVAEHDPLQPSGNLIPMGPVEESLHVDLIIDLTDYRSDDEEALHSLSEEEIGEFDDEDSISSNNSSDSE